MTEYKPAESAPKSAAGQRASELRPLAIVVRMARNTVLELTRTEGGSQTKAELMVVGRTVTVCVPDTSQVVVLQCAECEATNGLHELPIAR